MKKRHTLPGDTIPLANALQDIIDALLSGKNPTAPTARERDAALAAVIEIVGRPEINAMLDRIVPDRRS